MNLYGYYTFFCGLDYAFDVQTSSDSRRVLLSRIKVWDKFMNGDSASDRFNEIIIMMRIQGNRIMVHSRSASN